MLRFFVSRHLAREVSAIYIQGDDWWIAVRPGGETSTLSGAMTAHVADGVEEIGSGEAHRPIGERGVDVHCLIETQRGVARASQPAEATGPHQTSSALEAWFVVGQVIAAIGCVVLIVSQVFPDKGWWAAMLRDSPLAAVIVMVLGAIGLASVVDSLARKHQMTVHLVIAVTCGVTCLLVAVGLWAGFPHGDDFVGGSPDVEAPTGWYLLLAGGALLLIGGIVDRVHRS